jgi:hypothetical protein
MKKLVVRLLLIAASVATTLTLGTPAHADVRLVYACDVRIMVPQTNVIKMHFTGYSKPFCQGSSVGNYYLYSSSLGRDFVLSQYAEVMAAAREGMVIQVDASSSGDISTLFFRAAPPS